MYRYLAFVWCLFFSVPVLSSFFRSWWWKSLFNKNKSAVIKCALNLIKCKIVAANFGPQRNFDVGTVVKRSVQCRLSSFWQTFFSIFTHTICRHLCKLLSKSLDIHKANHALHRSVRWFSVLIYVERKSLTNFWKVCKEAGACAGGGGGGGGPGN